MKKIKRVVIALAVFMTVFANEVKAEEVLNIKATAYCYGTVTATGTSPKEGRTLAGRREWFGKIACVWEDRGDGIQPENFIGTYIVEDTGGQPIKDGYVIDIYMTDRNRCFEFGCKDVIVVLLDAEG